MPAGLARDSVAKRRALVAVKYLLIFLFFAVCLANILFLRLVTITDTFCDSDQGSPAYGARLLQQGQCPYSHAHLTKPPGSIVLYAALFSLFGLDMTPIHLVGALTIFLTAVCLFYIGWRHFGAAAGVLAAGLYTLYQANMPSAGICVNFESWCILPSVVCLTFALEPRPTRRTAFLAGLAACLALWMKQTAIFFLPLGALTLWLNAAAPAAAPALVARRQLLQWFGWGAVACCAFFLASMAAVSCLGSLLQLVNPFRLLAYRTSMQSESLRLINWQTTVARILPIVTTTYVLSGGLFASFLLFFANPVLRRAARPYFGAVLFFWGAAASIAAGGKYFGHYFVLAFPYACLVVGISLGVAPAAGPTHRKKVVEQALLVALVFLAAWKECVPQIRLARDAAENWWRTGDALSAELLHGNRGEQTNYLLIELEWQEVYRLLGRRLQERLRPGDTIWCFDYMATMHHYTRTFAPTRHQEHFEIVTKMTNYYAGLWFTQVNDLVQQKRRELLADLAARPPRFILRYAYPCPGSVQHSDREKPDFPRDIFHQPMSSCFPQAELFPELAAFLAANYHKENQNLTNAVDVYEWNGRSAG